LSYILKYKNKLKDIYSKIQRIFLIRKSITVFEFFSQVGKVIFIGDRHFLEKKKNFGNKNPNTTFYIIRRTPPGAGLFSNFLLVLMHLYYAEQYGYESIIDWKYYSNYYKEKNEINNTTNSWEYYFNQPTDTPLEEVYKSKNVILSRTNVNSILESEFLIKDLNQIDFLDDEEQINKFNEISKKIGLAEPIKEQIDKRLDNLFKYKKNILGIVLRGTDYLNNTLSRGHSTPFNAENSLEIVENYLNKWKMEYVYLSTEVNEYVELYKNHFKDKLILLERYRYKNDQNKKFINQYTRDRKNDKYLTGLEYLTEVYGLAKCDSIIGTSCGSLHSAIIINNNKYINKKIFNLGRNY
tara:strand:- start:2055 stop:3113 length:1059 start_codon:yes stop_codon:yes gene_type:complete